MSLGSALLASCRAASRTYCSTYPPSGRPRLDPAVRAMLDGAGGTPDPGTPRRLNEPVSSVETRVIEGPGGPLPVRVYTPIGEAPFPMVLFIHGGGWMVPAQPSHDDLCRSLTSRANVTVAAVDYRLAPEHPYPAALDDCMAALLWAASFGSRLAVAGDSAGGNLAAALSLRARDSRGPRITFQALIYPALDFAADTRSYRENATGYLLTSEEMSLYWSAYVPRAADRALPYVSPLRAPSLAGLPRALIQTAHFDPLRDEGEAYAARLHEAGVPVRCTRYLGMVHGYMGQTASIPDAGRALDEVAGALREAFA